MILLRSSSTPTISSMVDVGRSSQNSSTTGNTRNLVFSVDPSSIKWQSTNGRRVSSESNLNGMVAIEEATSQVAADSPIRFIEVMPMGRTSRNNNFKSKPKLEPILSFSNYENDDNDCTDEYPNDSDDCDMNVEFSFPLSTVTCMGTGTGDMEDYDKGFQFFNFSKWNNFPKPNYNGSDQIHSQEPTSMSMAAGLGINSTNTNLFIDNICIDDDRTTRYYEKVIRENPRNSLILRNYAQYLYKTKGDSKKAEELYSRAIMAEPNDGELLSEYARLRWEVHGEEESATNYFVSSVRAAPDNSDVLAAYASFLWETEERANVPFTTRQH